VATGGGAELGSTRLCDISGKTVAGVMYSGPRVPSAAPSGAHTYGPARCRAIAVCRSLDVLYGSDRTDVESGGFRGEGERALVVRDREFVTHQAVRDVDGFDLELLGRQVLLVELVAAELDLQRAILHGDAEPAAGGG